MILIIINGVIGTGTHTCRQMVWNLPENNTRWPIVLFQQILTSCGQSLLIPDNVGVWLTVHAFISMPSLATIFREVAERSQNHHMHCRISVFYIIWLNNIHWFDAQIVIFWYCCLAEWVMIMSLALAQLNATNRLVIFWNCSASMCCMCIDIWATQRICVWMNALASVAVYEFCALLVSA